MTTDKGLILSKIKSHYGLKTEVEFARFLGIKPQTLASWYKRNSFDIELLYSKCVDVNPDWLLTGEGEMLRNPTQEGKQGMIPAKNMEGIPLIPVSAMAGFGSGDMQVLEHECTYFVIPIFKEAEFLISVKGSSMQPKYNSGDIVACKKLPLDTFFQWNKVYVLDTEQGALVKRIKKGETPDTLTIISDNQNYEPFELHKSKIYSVAIVLGVIRQES